MDATDRAELDRLYARLLDRHAGPERPQPEVKTLSPAELQRLLLDSVQGASRDTDPILPK
jgi:hypothetical protein